MLHYKEKQSERPLDQSGLSVCQLLKSHLNSTLLQSLHSLIQDLQLEKCLDIVLGPMIIKRYSEMNKLTRALAINWVSKSVLCKQMDTRAAMIEYARLSLKKT